MTDSERGLLVPLFRFNALPRHLRGNVVTDSKHVSESGTANDLAPRRVGAFPRNRWAESNGAPERNPSDKVGGNVGTNTGTSSPVWAVTVGTVNSCMPLPLSGVRIVNVRTAGVYQATDVDLFCPRDTGRRVLPSAYKTRRSM